jgi:hypothetical protein
MQVYATFMCRNSFGSNKHIHSYVAFLYSTKLSVKESSFVNDYSYVIDY